MPHFDTFIEKKYIFEFAMKKEVGPCELCEVKLKIGCQLDDHFF